MLKAVMNTSSPKLCNFLVKRSDLISSEMISGYKRFPSNEHFRILNLYIIKNKYNNKYTKIEMLPQYDLKMNVTFHTHQEFHFRQNKYQRRY